MMREVVPCVLREGGCRDGCRGGGGGGAVCKEKEMHLLYSVCDQESVRLSVLCDGACWFSATRYSE